MSAPTPAFDSESQIRVLVVEAGEFSSPVTAHFQFCAVREDRDVQWEAISYAWDDQIPSKDIKLQGKMVQVADNVFRMLKNLRRPSQTRSLWIDAVCINQNDSDEKSKQVPLMRYIYQKAQSVIIWLDTQGAEDAASAIVLAASWMELKANSVSQSESRTLQALFSYEKPDVHWNGPFHRIAGLRWFQRIWPVQEATFGMNLQVCLGQNSITWDTFASTTIRFLSLLEAPAALSKTLVECYTVCRKRSFNEASNQGLSMIYLIVTLKTWLQESEVPISPSELAFLCKDRLATVPSDHLYAILGLVEAKRATSPAALFPVDYGLPSTEVYKRFTVWCIQLENNLDILAQQRNEDSTGPASRCSWTTDWDNQVLREFNLTQTSSLLSRLRQHSATHPKVFPLCRRMDHILAVRGYIVDDFGDDFFCLALTRQPSEENNRLYQEWLNKISKNEAANKLLFGEQSPTVRTLERLYSETVENDIHVSHVWRDGERSDLAVREPGAEFRMPFITKRGCLALTFPYLTPNPSPKICFLLGGRGLFVLKPVIYGRPANTNSYKLITGDCFIKGFEDGRGYEISKGLRLQEQDFFLL